MCARTAVSQSVSCAGRVTWRARSYPPAGAPSGHRASPESCMLLLSSILRRSSLFLGVVVSPSLSAAISVLSRELAPLYPPALAPGQQLGARVGCTPARERARALSLTLFSLASSSLPHYQRIDEHTGTAAAAVTAIPLLLRRRGPYRACSGRSLFMLLLVLSVRLPSSASRVCMCTL